MREFEITCTDCHARLILHVANAEEARIDAKANAWCDAKDSAQRAGQNAAGHETLWMVCPREGRGRLNTLPEWTDEEERESIRTRCPLCGSNPGVTCLQTPAPHVARIEAYQRQHNQ